MSYRAAACVADRFPANDMRSDVEYVRTMLRCRTDCRARAAPWTISGCLPARVYQSEPRANSETAWRPRNRAEWLLERVGQDP